MINFFRKKAKVINQLPPNHILFDVNTFNNWFNDKNNNAVYAHTGIFLRLDKLSESHIKDYLLKYHNINSAHYDLCGEIRNFYYEIRKDWLNKLQ